MDAQDPLKSGTILLGHAPLRCLTKAADKKSLENKTMVDQLAVAFGGADRERFTELLIPFCVCHSLPLCRVRVCLPCICLAGAGVSSDDLCMIDPHKAWCMVGSVSLRDNVAATWSNELLIFRRNMESSGPNGLSIQPSFC